MMHTVEMAYETNAHLQLDWDRSLGAQSRACLSATALQCLNPETNPLSDGRVQLICWGLPFQSPEFGQIEEKIR